LVHGWLFSLKREYWESDFKTDLQTMLIPIPATLKANPRVQDLKKRLDWGEPPLTIIR
jgi:hypothetical protein